MVKHLEYDNTVGQTDFRIILYACQQDLLLLSNSVRTCEERHLSRTTIARATVDNIQPQEDSLNTSQNKKSCQQIVKHLEYEGVKVLNV